MNEKKPPEFLSINDISFAFIAASISYGIATFIFFVEKSYHVLRIFIKDLVGLFCVMRLIANLRH